MMLHLGKPEILELLARIGADLSRRGLSASVYIFGGSALIVQGLRNDVTVDIDMWTHDSAVLGQIGSRLQQEFGFENNPVDSRGRGFVFGPAIDTEAEEMIFDSLVARFASPRVLLAHKLSAFRAKDVGDIVELMKRLDIRSAEQAVAIAREYFGDDHVPAVDYEGMAIDVSNLLRDVQQR